MIATRLLLACSCFAAALGACGLNRSGTQPASDGTGATGAAGGFDSGPVGPGGNGAGPADGGSGGSGGAPACDDPGDCPPTGTACVEPTCRGGSCGMADADAGTDCSAEGGVSCDGAGFCLLADGASCTDASQCQSGQCINLICCPCAAGVCTLDLACAAGTHLWSIKLGATNAQVPLAIASDGSDDVLVGGYFEGTVDFGEGDVTADQEDAFLLKRSGADGSYVWSATFSGMGDQRVNAVAIGANDVVAIAGELAQNIDFGGGVTLDPSGTDVNGFVALFDGLGVCQWAVALGGTSDDRAFGVAFDPDDGGVVVTGAFRGDVDFGGLAHSSAGLEDLFVVKLAAADGGFVWDYVAGNGQTQQGRDVVVAPITGRVAVVGSATGDLMFDGATVVPGLGQEDVFLLELDSAGAYAAVARFGSTGADAGLAIARDANNGRYAIGGETGVGEINFGGGVLLGGGGNDAFVAVFDASLGHQWSKRYGLTGTQTVNDLAFDGGGRVIAVGEVDGMVDFGAGVVSATADDLFVVKLDSDGSYLWSLLQIPLSNQRAHGVTTDSSDNVLFAAELNGTIDLGGGPLTTAGSEDVLLAKLAP